MSLFIRHGQPFAAFGPAGCQHPATIFGGHAALKTVLVFSFSYRGLKCPFHYSKIFFRAYYSDCWLFSFALETVYTPLHFQDCKDR